MGLFDLPEIDNSAKNSEASEKKIEALLCLDTGFISRKEIPDKGCDYMVELVVDSRNTGLKFPLQLKSIEKLRLVGGDNYISYQIKTSRLGYMLQHIPTTGIFALYDTETQKCFYDFSDIIYDRIMEDRKSDEWIKNDYVNIRVPLENELNVAGINILKEKMRSRFKQAAKMQAAFGKKYGLPIANLLKEEFDIHNPEHLKSLLKNYGLIFLSQYDISILYHSLENISGSQISSDKDLLVLAALAYCEVGKYLDSDLFLRKARAKFDLSDQEKKMLAFVELKNKLQLGEITGQAFQEGIENFKGESELNNIILDINILRYSLVNEINVVKNQSYKDKLKDIYDRIIIGNLSDTTKQLYNLWNALNESLIIGNTFSYNITLARTSESVGNTLTLQEKRERILGYLNEENAFLKRISDIYASAKASENNFVQATALQLSAIHLVQHIIFTIGLELPTDGLEQKIQKRVAEAIESYNLFVGLQLNKDAHYSLHITIELLDAAKAIFDSSVDKDLGELTGVTSKMERELMFDPIPRTIIELINDKKQQKEAAGKRPPMASLKGTSNAHLDTIAHIFMRSANLPDDTYKNVLDSLKAYRLFYDRCSNPDIIPREKRHDGSYQHSIIFVLINQKTGLTSLESTDMDNLLLSWGF